MSKDTKTYAFAIAPSCEREACSKRPCICVHRKAKRGGREYGTDGTAPRAAPGAFNGAITNSQHGRVRWYLVHTPYGKERETCEKVRCIIPHNLMQDAFVMQKEFLFKRDGAWSLQTKPMYKEYFFVATHDAAALDRALAQLSFGCRIAGSRERAYMPMPDDAQDWYRSVLDDDGVVRNSIARIEDGVLHIEQGPLVGQEARVKKIDRHKRWCLVDVGVGDSAFRELLPLDVPSKT